MLGVLPTFEVGRGSAILVRASTRLCPKLVMTLLNIVPTVPCLLFLGKVPTILTLLPPLVVSARV